MSSITLKDTKNKEIEAIIKPPAPHYVGDGFFVHNFFPSNNLINQKRMSPFFLFDYNAKMNFPPSEKQRGVGVHPHRGFETVTIAYHGKIAHHDSTGNSGVIGQGDVQWMTAGAGILHKEYHEKEFSQKGGLFQMCQLWVNLPSKYKMTPPKYQALLHENMGKYNIENSGGVINVIAGEYKGVKGAASTFTPMHVFDIRLNENSSIDLDFPETYNTGLIVIEGSIKINDDKEVNENNFVLFKNKGNNINITCKDKSIVLVLSGEPIEEDHVAYGPFVMSSWDEIEQAVLDFNSGKFGYLED